MTSTWFTPGTIFHVIFTHIIFFYGFSPSMSLFPRESYALLLSALALHMTALSLLLGDGEEVWQVNKGDACWSFCLRGGMPSNCQLHRIIRSRQHQQHTTALCKSLCNWGGGPHWGRHLQWLIGHSVKIATTVGYCLPTCLSQLAYYIRWCEMLCSRLVLMTLN